VVVFLRIVNGHRAGWAAYVDGHRGRETMYGKTKYYYFAGAGKREGGG